MGKRNFKTPVIYATLFIIIFCAIAFAAMKYLSPTASTANKDELKDLIQLSATEAAASPVEDSDSLIEIFAYGCHYCAINENNLSKMAARLPAGKSFRQLHLSLPGAAFSRTDTLFATLTVMGIEKQYREKIYHAINEEHIDLGTQAVRDMWLQKNNIDVAAFDKASTSAQTQALLNYMAKISAYYKIRGTPTFIINKKWVALQDRSYPAFSDHLLSLVEKDLPLEK
ncbi:DsbA family protein [Atlantibacter hermannii]|uniref:DsbA family protein n=1 Tax=Atlantibacter hermannii TaxID=565 RepID=UPI00289D51DF|nr:DsbA family protein [Atlantibacter hermannii]